MANSRFQYVRKFELPDALLQDTYLVARLDGHRFTKFTTEHGFTKPNDERGLALMVECARQVMSEWSDIVMAYGQSDEFSFLLPASSSLYGRRSAKLSTSFVSLFSSSFVFYWPKHFPDTPLLYPPNFDARVIAYPTAEHIRDYFNWRQADCHINNLYNTCFWALVIDGESKQNAQAALKGTSSGDKNELLFSRFGINYNEIPQMFRKGTTLFRVRPRESTPTSSSSGGASSLPQTASGSEERATGKSSAGPMDAHTTTRFHGDEASVEDQRLNERPLSIRPETSGVVKSSKLRQPLGDTSKDERNASASYESQGDKVTKAYLEEWGVSTDRAEFPEGFGSSRHVPSLATGVLETARGSITSGIARSGAALSVKAKIEGESKSEQEVQNEVLKGEQGRSHKRLVKKGHAPSAAVEEEVCDIIRNNFWDRNPHILAGVERRR